MTVTPAYGRDYTTAKAAKADWKAGKDFILQAFGNRWDGKPVNIESGANITTIRFAKLRKVCAV